MKTSRVLLSVLLPGMCFLFAACVLLEETGSGQRTGNPQQTPTRIDTSRHLARFDTTRKAPIDSAAMKKRARIAPRFKSTQDTVRASLTKGTKSAARRRPIVRPENPMYTIQIGAFGKAPNALRNQKLAKERFADQPVFNNYSKADNIYRVSVGKFEEQKSAESLRKIIMKKFSKDYAECWVNYIAK
ncbi:MAG: SPOR domain-containing protein [Bacteroidota bacterium]